MPPTYKKVKQHDMQGRSVYAHGSRKSKNKIMLGLNTSLMAATQETVIYINNNAAGSGIVTIPCTIGGLRWDLGITGSATTSCNWAIVVVRNGNGSIVLSAPTPVSSLTAAPFLMGTTPKDVICFGTIQQGDLNSTNVKATGSTKSMRKLNSGDSLVLCTYGSAAAGAITGTIQYFSMT